MSDFLAYHMSYTASAITIGAILVPLYCWIKFARTPRIHTRYNCAQCSRIRGRHTTRCNRHSVGPDPFARTPKGRR